MDKELEKALEIFSREKIENSSHIDSEKHIQLIVEGATWMYNQLKDKLCKCGGSCGCTH